MSNDGPRCPKCGMSMVAKKGHLHDDQDQSRRTVLYVCWNCGNKEPREVSTP